MLQPLVWLRLLLAMLGLTAMKLARAWTVWEYTLHRTSIVPEATCRSSTPCRLVESTCSQAQDGWCVQERQALLADALQAATFKPGQTIYKQVAPS